jgi:hypothetical protein
MALEDKSPGAENAPSGPYGRWVAITPGAGDLAEIPRAIQNTGSAGTITCTGRDNVSGVLYAIQGQILPIRPNKITAVGAGVVVMALY